MNLFEFIRLLVGGGLARRRATPSTFEKVRELSEFGKFISSEIQRCAPAMSEENRKTTCSWLIVQYRRGDKDASICSAFRDVIEGKPRRARRRFVRLARLAEKGALRAYRQNSAAFSAAFLLAAAAIDLLVGGKKCVAYVEQSIRLRPQELAPQEWLGDWFAMKGQKSKAESVYRTALRLIQARGSDLQAAFERQAYIGGKAEAWWEIRDNENAIKRLGSKLTQLS